MFVQRRIAGFSGGLRRNQEEIESWKARMSAEGWTCYTKRFRGCIRFEKWVPPVAFCDGRQPLLFQLPRLRKKRRKR